MRRDYEKLIVDGLRTLAGPREGSRAAKLEDLAMQLSGLALAATNRGRPATEKQCHYLASLLNRRDLDGNWVIERLPKPLRRSGMTSLEASRLIDLLLSVPSRPRASDNASVVIPIRGNALQTSNSQQLLHHFAIEEFGPKERASFVHRVLGLDANNSWVFAKMPGRRDYSESNSEGTRGITLNYIIAEGVIYFASRSVSWASVEEFFMTIRNGTHCRMTEKQVLECLEK